MNYYDILGVRKTASQEDIKKAYKNLVKKYHPDIYSGDKSFAEKKTVEINAAYDILSNPESRQKYDEEISPKANYTYTPPNYSKSYDEYKKRYTSYNPNNVRDGSEHDYSTYTRYNNHYTNYHHSQTGNSNYSHNESDFSNIFFESFEKLSNLNKKRVIIVAILIYLFLILYLVIQFYQFMSGEGLFSTNKNTSPLTNSIKNEIEEKNNSETKPYTNTYEKDSNTTSKPTVIEDDSILYYYYTKKELEDFYEDFINLTGSQKNFNEFCLYLEESLPKPTN